MRVKTACRLIKPGIREGLYMVKIYVVDTNVLIQAPYAIESFEDNEVVLPMAVIEELDHLKKAGRRSWNERPQEYPAVLEQLRQKADLLTGVQMGKRRKAPGRKELYRCGAAGRSFPGEGG